MARSCIQSRDGPAELPVDLCPEKGIYCCLDIFPLCSELFTDKHIGRY